jgi:hypothetical protein
MLKTLRILMVGFAVMAVSPAYSACTFPQEVSIPDGATASNEGMLKGQTMVKEYLADMEGYLDCLDQEETSVPENQTPEAKKLHVERHNAAVDAMEAMAAKFNQQIRAYKLAN